MKQTTKRKRRFTPVGEGKFGFTDDQTGRAHFGNMARILRGFHLPWPEKEEGESK